MANFDTIKTAIDANIKTNGTQDITGGKMNSILKQMVDATDEQLTELESNINSAQYNIQGIAKDLGKIFRPSVNLFNHNTILHNQRLKGASVVGVPKSASGYYVSDYIEVAENDVLVASFNGNFATLNGYCTYDANKTGISYYEYFGPAKIGAGVKYIRIEAKETLGDVDFLQIQKGSIVTSFEPFGQDVLASVPPVVIKADGTGDYISIREAFEKEGVGKVYHVYEGEYDVASYFSEDEILSANYSSDGNGFVGLRVPNESIVQGIGVKDNIVVRLTLDANKYGYTIRENIATLNLFGNCHVENMTIIAENARTAIHDDFKASANCTHIIKDCKLINKVVERATSHGFGLGLRSGVSILVKDTYIYPSLICHSNVGFAKSPKVVFDGVDCAGVFNLQDDNSGVATEVILKNVSYGVLNMYKGDAIQKMNILLLNACEDSPIVLNDIIVRGGVFHSCPAIEKIEKGQVIGITYGSSNIRRAFPTNNIYEMVGVAINSANVGEEVIYQTFGKAIPALTLGLSNDVDGGTKVGIAEKRIVLDVNGEVGIIVKHGNLSLVQFVV